MLADTSRDELYRQTVLDHSRNPRNFRRPAAPDRTATGHNPLCGDKISVYLCLDHDRLADVAFEASGCAICTASASLMSGLLTGLSAADAQRAVDAFIARFAPGTTTSAAADDPLAALDSVRSYPSRIRCATLPWQTARAALQDTRTPVTTE